MPSRAHTSSHMSGHHLATVRRAGRKRGARFESSEALAEQPAVVRSAVELHRCCARVSRAAALEQHIDGVARASSAGTKSGSIAHSLVLLTMLAPVSRCARFGDQLGHVPSAGHFRRRFANLQRQRGPAGPRNSGFRANTPREKTHASRLRRNNCNVSPPKRHLFTKRSWGK